MDIGRGGAGNSRNLGGIWGHAPPDSFKISNPRNTISSVLGSDFTEKRITNWKFGNELIGIELNSESEIACSMCARSVLSASLGFFIFFNKSELGSHFSILSVLLCLIQIEIIGGAQASPAPPPHFRRP